MSQDTDGHYNSIQVARVTRILCMQYWLFHRTVVEVDVEQVQSQLQTTVVMIYEISRLGRSREYNLFISIMLLELSDY